MSGQVLRAVVTLTLDGHTYAPSEELGAVEPGRAAELVRYGYAEETPSRPVRRRKKTAQ